MGKRFIFSLNVKAVSGRLLPLPVSSNFILPTCLRKVYRDTYNFSFTIVKVLQALVKYEYQFQQGWLGVPIKMMHTPRIINNT
jgi:hypothetical protein